MAPARMKQPVSLPCRPRCLEFGSASARWTSSVCPTPASWHKETSPGLDPETRPWGSASLAYCPPSQVLHHGDNSWPLCNPCSNGPWGGDRTVLCHSGGARYTLLCVCHNPENFTAYKMKKKIFLSNHKQGKAQNSIILQLFHEIKLFQNKMLNEGARCHLRLDSRLLSGMKRVPRDTPHTVLPQPLFPVPVL